ncbi:MAG: SMI1/KNR4 family protein [Betaproteobacteria bacterium]
MTWPANGASEAMFNITPGMRESWLRRSEPKATVAELALIEESLGISLPQPYVDFVTRYGFVEFGRDPERRLLFTYVIDERGQRVTRQREVRFLFEAAKVVSRYRYMISLEDPENETRPMLPPGFLPVASDAGHGAILLDVATNPGQVWFWPESEWRWGTEDNLALGFVADHFEDFINALRPNPL